MNDSTTRSSASLMIVDDSPDALGALESVLRSLGYRVAAFSNGRSALAAAAYDPPDMFILDISMPGMDGYELSTRLRENRASADTPIIFLSGHDEPEDKSRAYAAGAVDYLVKPFEMRELALRVDTHLGMRAAHRELELDNVRLRQLLDEQTREVMDSQLATIFALAKLAENRDNDTGRHIERTQRYCIILAEELGKTPEFATVVDETFRLNLYHAAPLHDIGKVGISDSVLLKPGPLTPEEFELIKTHAMLGYETLRVVQEMYPRNDFIATGAEIARWHHERWDGTGYPDGLAKDDIPLSARIMAVADVYDALRSERPYKPAIPHAEVVNRVVADRGRHFDPAAVDAFLAVEREFERVSNALVDECEPVHGLAANA
ncbi:MAG: HD-GYP domain-containing protein [Spirochaetota bacterium]